MFPFYPMLAAGGAAEDQFLSILALALLLAVGTSLLLGRLKLPPLPGYFLCGVLLAVSGLVDLNAGAPATVLLSQMGNVGIILLMFTIGLESSLHELMQLRRTGLFAGSVQLGLTSLVAAIALSFLGLSGMELGLTAFLVALSSTAVGLKLFKDFALTNHPGARMTLGVALLQDMAVILLLVLLPGLTSGLNWSEALKLTGILLVKGVVFFGLAAVLSRYGIPRFLKIVSQSGSRELFTLSVLALCAGIATLGSLLGLNSALGAFAAGLAVSGSVYSHRIMADASTFRDFFLTIFFVSVGAFVDVAFFLSNAVPLLAGAAVIILIKAAVLTLAGRWSHVPLRGALLSGIALSGIGEFAVVVAGKAAESGLLSPLVTQTLLIEVVLTLGLSPLIMRAAIPLTRSWESARSGKAIKPESGKHFSKRMREIHDHAILCGYGTVGRMVHEALERLKIPVVIVELNALTARRLIKEGHSVLFADISQADTMELAGVDRARVMVITFPHVGLARTAITIARERNPKLVTLCRARFPSEVEELRAVVPMGIVHDEREAGLEMLRLCLTAYDRDAAEIELATSDLIITEEEQEPPTESVPSLGT